MSTLTKNKNMDLLKIRIINENEGISLMGFECKI